MSENPTTWKPLIDEWVIRESALRPDMPVIEDSVRVRDAVEVDDQAFVLVSYEVNWPWPKEENGTSGESGSESTAVLQAQRVRQPWVERDATTSVAEHGTESGSVRLHEHLLGTRRVFAGCVTASDTGDIVLEFGSGKEARATVVDGWFMAVVQNEQHVRTFRLADGKPEVLHRMDVGGVFPEAETDRTGAAAPYFSPLDLRSVVPLIQWKRAGEIVLVATSMERYDDGGILRLRIDGVRADDDLFSSWPSVAVSMNDKIVKHAICGEYWLADTVSLDIGFRPWVPDGTQSISVTVEDLRGADGIIGPVDFEIAID